MISIQNIEAFRESFFSIISTSENVVISAHFSPDDDSIASVLSVYSILKVKFPEKNIRIIYTGESVSRYNIFNNFEKIEWVDDIANHLKEVDALILLDVGKFSRSSHIAETLPTIKNTICIDHHGSTPETFTLALIEPDYSSNAELVYTALGGEQYLDKNLAEIFLLGILGDTGNLTHIDGHQTQVFSIVKKLVEVGNIRIDSFLSRYRTIPKEIVPLLQEFVKNTTYKEVPGWPDVQYSFVTRAFSEEHNFSDEDMSSASHIYMGQYLPRIETQPWGFVFSPRSDGGVRMSSRSMLGSVNVRIFSESLGVGGGHDRASGANFKNENGDVMQVDACIEKVFEFMKNNQPVLS